VQYVICGSQSGDLGPTGFLEKIKLGGRNEGGNTVCGDIYDSTQKPTTPERSPKIIVNRLNIKSLN
jgi:hypothetical protein